MQPGGVYPGPSAAPEDPLDRLAASAKGWHSIQMAVLGFIGICGVLRSGNGAGPAAVQWFAAFLSVSSLVVALIAIGLVGRVAYPFYGGTSFGPTDPQRIATASAQLRNGIRTTFGALILIVVAALSGWWPSNATEGVGGATASVVQVQGQGREWCGTIVDAPPGQFSVETSDGLVTVPVRAVDSIRPAASC